MTGRSPPSHAYNRWGVALPLAMLVVGGVLLFGCIPLPGSYSTTTGDVRPERKIGRPGQRRLLTLGQATRQRTVEVLGQPMMASEDGSVYVFHYSVETARYFWPLCFGTTNSLSGRYLAVSFDREGRLEKYKVFKSSDAARTWAGLDLKGVERATTLPGIEPAIATPREDQ